MAAKGIEPQTLKLFEVCRLRDIPIITYINKMDREAQDPFTLLDEIEQKLAMSASPLYWPQGSGERLRGMKDLRTGVVSSSPDDVLDGALDPYMAAALSQKVTGEKVVVEDVD